MKISKKIKALMLAGVVSFSLVGLVGCSDKSAENTTETAQTETADTTEVEVKVKEVKGADLEKAMEQDGVILVDVRDAKSYDEGHIKDAINVSFDDVKNGKLGVLEEFKDQPILVYCNTGNKSGQVADMLVEKGYKNVSNVEGVQKYTYDLTTYKNVTGSQLEKVLADNKDVILVDVRPSDMFEEAHIKGAVNVPFDKVAENKDKLSKDKEIYVYCNTGNKSSTVASELSKDGYNVVNSIQGVKEYKFANVE